MNNIGYAAGAGGKVFQTMDNGSTWTALSKGSTDVLNSVCFVNDSTGYAAGGIYSPGKGTILKTTDGGENWTDLDCGISEYLFSVYFTGINTGFVAGTRGLIAKTTDGGESWTTLYSNDSQEFHSVCFPDNNIGYAAGLGLLKTTNGGNDWFDISPVMDLYLRSLYFFDQNTGYAAGFDYTTFSDVIIKTIDGGQTWSFIHLASQSGLTGIHFTDYNHGFAVGTGVAYKTTDGGESWSQMLAVGNLELLSVFMSFFLTLVSLRLKEVNFLKHPTEVIDHESSTITDNPLKSIFFTDPETGYVVGYNGNIFKTTNGGGYDAIPEVVATTAKFNLYPNPATSKVTLICPSESAGNIDVMIYDIHGKLLFNNTLNAHNNFELDVSNLLSGLYLLKIRYKEGVETKKLAIR